MFLVKPDKVRRADGTPIAIFKSLTVGEEIRGALKCFKDWRILLIAEAIFCCEFPLSIIPAVNASHFNARTRALNSLCFYVISPPLCILISWMLDWKKYDRRTRGFYTIVFVYIVLIASWAGLFGFLTSSKWSALAAAGGADWTEDGYGGPLIMFMCFGGVYTLHQFLVMWIMSLCELSRERCKNCCHANAISSF